RVAEAIVALRDAVVQQRGRVVDRSHALEARERLVEAAVPEQGLAFAERGAKRGAILGADAIGEEAGTRRKVPEVRGRQAQQQLDTTLATATHDPIETLAEVLVTLRELARLEHRLVLDLARRILDVQRFARLRLGHEREDQLAEA